jgi:hypothetical protein
MTARHVAWARATFGVQPAEAGAGGTAAEASGGSAGHIGEPAV